MKLSERISKAWNVFKNPIDTTSRDFNYGFSKHNRRMTSFSNESSMINPIYTRIAIDAAAVSIRHSRVDDQDRYKETMVSGLSTCLSRKANIDQTGRELIQDLVLTLCDNGVAVLVPVDAEIHPRTHNYIDIYSMRVGTVVTWYPKHVNVSLYDENEGERKEILVKKENVVIVENPLYSVMNEPNSTLKRLVRKINLLDQIDEKNLPGKLDLIFQLPYSVKTEARRAEAERRRNDLESQLAGKRFGIGYIDATEKITQLNRPAENNLTSQIEYLTKMLYSQLGLTEAVFNGTANEQEFLNYYNRTIEPILSAVTEKMEMVLISKTAYTQGQRIKFFREPFKLVPINNIAEIADSFTRNEILSSNEIRSIVGFKPVDTKEADALRNSNLNHPEDMADEYTQEDYDENMGDLDEIDSEFGMAHYASIYYDPVKAHEYYMQHRKLKGRRPRLNDTGKAALKYVKGQMRDERKI